MRNSSGSSQGDLWLKGQSCFWFPLSALAEHGGRGGKLWVGSGGSQRGQGTGAPGAGDQAPMAGGVGRNPGVRNSAARSRRGRCPPEPSVDTELWGHHGPVWIWALQGQGCPQGWPLLSLGVFSVTPSTAGFGLAHPWMWMRISAGFGGSSRAL